jgi:hypothetical protein
MADKQLTLPPKPDARHCEEPATALPGNLASQRHSDPLFYSLSSVASRALAMKTAASPRNRHGRACPGHPRLV